jgi:hypothetical protein
MNDREMHSDLASCEDSDTGCHHCAGRCTRSASVILYRRDMEDATGSLFCDPCAEDAMESGCFMVLEENAIQYDLI